MVRNVKVNARRTAKIAMTVTMSMDIVEVDVDLDISLNYVLKVCQFQYYTYAIVKFHLRCHSVS